MRLYRTCLQLKVDGDRLPGDDGVVISRIEKPSRIVADRVLARRNTRDGVPPVGASDGAEGRAGHGDRRTDNGLISSARTTP